MWFNETIWKQDREAVLPIWRDVPVFRVTRSGDSEGDVINEQGRQMDDGEEGGVTLLICSFNK